MHRAELTHNDSNYTLTLRLNTVLTIVISQGKQLQKFINVEPIPPALVVNGQLMGVANKKKNDDGDDDDGYDGGHFSPRNGKFGAVTHIAEQSFADHNDEYGRSRSDTVQSADPTLGLSDSPQFATYRKTMTAGATKSTSINPEALMTPIRAQMEAEQRMLQQMTKDSKEKIIGLSNTVKNLL